jgi:hypothetical protein
MRASRKNARTAARLEKAHLARVERRMGKADQLARDLFPLVKTWGAKVSLTPQTRKERTK